MSSRKKSVGSELGEIVEAAALQLRSLSEAEASAAPSPGKWSAKQIVGHLIDSASNNHGRFVRARFTEDLVFAGYEQEDWVIAQDYQVAPWPELVELWRLFNLHIARVMDSTPDAVRHTPRAKHNLHEVAWRAIPESETATLEYLMRDYVAHLAHHLSQVRY